MTQLIRGTAALLRNGWPLVLPPLACSAGQPIPAITFLLRRVCPESVHFTLTLYSMLIVLTKFVSFSLEGRRSTAVNVDQGASVKKNDIDIWIGLVASLGPWIRAMCSCSPGAGLAMICMRNVARSFGRWKLMDETGREGRIPIRGPRIGGEDNGNFERNFWKSMKINELTLLLQEMYGMKLVRSPSSL